MFDFVRKHTRLIQFLLFPLIVLGFVGVGIQGYTSLMSEANNTVATVGGRKITQAEWDASQREQMERIRAQNPTVDPKLLDTPEFKRSTLDDLVRRHVLETAAADEHLQASMQRAQDYIKNDPSFASIYGPDGKVNTALLAAQGLTPEMLLQRVQQGMTQQQVLAGVGVTTLANTASATLAFDAILQQREIRVQVFDPKSYEAAITPSQADIEAYYKDPANAAQFTLPESADIQYLTLDLDALKSGIKVSDADLKKYYDENASRYTVAEERRASHILIKVDKSASADERAKAKAKAEEILAEVRKNPGSFADLAKKYSQDEGSASNGGDLDFFGRGAMVKPFEDAAFALKQGEISNVIESDFGYHIIELTGVRGGEKKSFDEVRPQIEEAVGKELAEKRYTEVADGFTNTVFDQGDSLQPAADKFKLTIQTATVERKPVPTASGPLLSPKLLDAVFSADVLKNKHNTQAIETSPNQLVSARVVQYHPAALQPLAQVQERVRALLVHRLAVEQADKAGKERLAALQKPDADLTGLSVAQVVSRAKSAGLAPKILDAILSADASKLPTTVGVDGGDGSFTVARIEQVLPRDPAVIDAKRLVMQYAQTWNGAETAAYMEALKSRYKVSVTPPAIAASAP